MKQRLGISFLFAMLPVLCGCQPSVGHFSIENAGAQRIENVEVSVSGTTFSYRQIEVGKKISQSFFVNGDSHFDLKYTFSGRTEVARIGYVTKGMDNDFAFKIVERRIFLNGQEGK